MNAFVAPLRVRCYRRLVQGIQRLLLPFWVDEERILRAKDLYLVPPGRSDPTRRRVWFHAASVGELESLWPLIELASLEPEVELVLTVFSSSAYQHVIRTMNRLKKGTVLFAGYSPWEGDWERAIDRFRPHLFVTAKYEAWPELWAALSARKIPLSIVGAKWRSSLRTAKSVLRTLGGRPPQMTLYTFNPENEPALRRAFPHAQVVLTDDPRWDRVFQRVSQAPTRIAELEAKFAAFPKPWGIAGQVWGTDLREWIRNQILVSKGTIWFVPHKIDERSVAEVEILMRDLGYSPVRTTDKTGLLAAGKHAVLVDEMGILAELYSIADWAYVGGGFGAGVHSTIEPAVQGIPLFAGTRGAEKFDEIALLVGEGQLRLLRSPQAWKDFNHAVAVGELRFDRDQARRRCATRKGAASRVWSELRQKLPEVSVSTRHE